jgi:hypothetical protein
MDNRREFFGPIQTIRMASSFLSFEGSDATKLVAIEGFHVRADL